MELLTIITTILEIIGGATVLLHFTAPLTKWKGDDKLLNFLEKLLKIISMNRENGKLEITLRKKE
tara:strand:+ start:205 stop:399 length:195 start_codon:yes stop_codon:yes gene_type:complete